MTTDRFFTARTLVCLLAMLAFASLASAGAAFAAPAFEAAPSVSSDKADYAPGELVTLSGASWGAGEVVHIRVNDDAGSSWSRDVDVTADDAGVIADRFNLPEWFVAEYSVTATGAAGSVATWTFTDGNVKARTNAGGFTFRLDWTRHNGSKSTPQGVCSAPAANQTTGTALAVGFSGGAQFSDGVASDSSEVLRAADTASDGKIFTGWTGDTATDTLLARTDPHEICVTGDFTGSRTYVANYAVNSEPTLTRVNASTTVNEGQTATNTGTWADANPLDTVTLSASAGTITKNANGTWSWSLATTDGTDQSQTVTITATDNHGGTSTTTFALTVKNVAPTVTLATGNEMSVSEGTTQHTYSYTISDPGADTVSAVTTSCGANGTKVAASDTNTNTTGSFKCTFADGPDTSVVSASTTDSDNATGTPATQTVTVANVAPTVTLAPGGDLSVSEGSTQHTYSYTISDPGADTVSAVTTSCGANGTKVAASDTNTNTTGSFKCVFADGPGTSVVSASASDSDNATGNLDTQTVTVANVAPTVTLTGPATADEGQTKSYSFSVVDPGQDTFTVDAGFPDCDAGATNNGDYVAGSLSVNPSGGSFQCLFADGPSSANVKIKVTDADGASDTASESVQIVAVANVAPTVTAPANQTANEGASTSPNLGSFSDPGPDSPWAVDVDWGDGSANAAFNMTLTGTLGSLNHTYADGPATRTVSVKVTDKTGASNTKTFTVAVANVAPAVALDAGSDLSVLEGSAHTYGYTITDPGRDTVTSVATSCGANGVKSDATNSDSAGSFKCTFADGPASSTVSASATDSDADAGNVAGQTVAVANVAPTVALDAGNDLSVNEGSAEHSYSYSIADPGADTVSSVATSCGAEGAKVSGSDTNTDTSGSFKCTFADGPNTSVVSASATDSDSAAGNLATQSVTVANVAPSVSLTGPATADEGDTKTYSFLVTDPGADTFTVDSGFPDCDAGATNNGSYVSESLAVIAAGGSFDCFFADGPATANVKIKVSDSDGASDTASESVQIVQVANVAPSVTAAADQTAAEGSEKTFAVGSFTDPGPDGPWAVSVDWGDGSTPTTFTATSPGSLGTHDHTYADNGSYTVSVKVTDNNNDSNTDTFTVAVSNVAPTVALDAGNDLSVNEGSAEHSYSYTISDPGADTVSSVHTSCGTNGDKVAGSDTNTNTTGSFKCVFPDGPESSTVSASATDSDNDTGADDSQTVAVANVAPTVNVTGASQADEGSTHKYTFTVSDPGADGFDASAGYPDCDAGTTNDGTLVAGSYTATASGGTFKCFFADGPATANVKMKVADSDGASGTDSESVQVVNVVNVAPSVTAPANQAADEGAAKSVDLGSFTDPGPDSPWAVDVGWGDGSAHTTFDAASTGSLGSRSHTYGDGPATRTVTVKVTDKHGASDTKTFTVAVANVDPTADLGNNGPKPEASPVTVSFTNPADPSSDDVAAGFHYGFACTASTALPTTYAGAGTDASKSCTFLDNGTYVVKGRIFDRDNGYRTYDTSVTVTNVAPTITSFTGTNSLAGPLAFAPSTFTTDFTDPGTLDTHKGDFTWSSGLPSSQTVSPFVTGQKVTHTFTAGCNRNATVKVTDDDGGFDTKSTSVNVGTGTWLPPLVDQPISDKLRNGQVLPVKVKIADCNGVAVTGLTPVIQLVRGDQTAVNDDGTELITISSVSAADTGTTMRESGGAYMYNLRVNVAAADLTNDFTIIIYPYGTGTPQTLRHVIVPIK